GIMCAIGFRRRAIIGLVLGEAAIIGALGGGPGVLFAHPLIDRGIRPVLGKKIGSFFPDLPLPPAAGAGGLAPCDRRGRGRRGGPGRANRPARSRRRPAKDRMTMIPFIYNVRSLAVRKTTTLLTAAGVAGVVFVLSAALMLQSGIHETLGRAGNPNHAIVLR